MIGTNNNMNTAVYNHIKQEESHTIYIIYYRKADRKNITRGITERRIIKKNKSTTFIFYLIYIDR